jgi:hypothetical protein
VLEALTVEPLDVKAISIVSDQFISTGHALQEVLDHGLVVSDTIPRKREGTAMIFPLPGNTDDGTLLRDVVVGDTHLEAWRPEVPLTWGGFDVPEHAFDTTHREGSIG